VKERCEKDGSVATRIRGATQARDTERDHGREADHNNEKGKKVGIG